MNRLPTWGEFAQLLTSVAVVGAMLLSWRNGWKIDAVHQATNSLTDRLVETTRIEAHAAGVKEEKDRSISSTTG